MSDAPYADIEDAANRVADGSAVLIDTDQTVLALFVTRDGNIQIKSHYDNPTTAQILRQIADKAEARG